LLTQQKCCLVMMRFVAVGVLFIIPEEDMHVWIYQSVVKFLQAI
jgi:hypothetical protein